MNSVASKEKLVKGNKKILLRENVWDAALNRIRWAFDEFENIVVGISGGKDSTVVLELALIVARERGRLPLNVMFLDQEGEWLATIDTVREIMQRPEVKPYWLQIPFRLFNATSTREHWLHCWDPEKEDLWIRPKEEIAIKENVIGADRFGDIFPAFINWLFPGQKACYLAGMRGEESPNRFKVMTQAETYKGKTWGKVLDRGREQFTFYPIYDWSYTDVWKAIHDNQWPYCRIYDVMYQYGVNLNGMRVSSLFHETAVRSLFYMQEVEPENYVRLVKRLEGIDMAGKMGFDNYFCPEKHPPMFRDWKEYRDYLLEHLITDEKWKVGFRKKFAQMDEDFMEVFGEKLYRIQIQSILTNDHEHVKLNAISVPRHLYDEHKRKKKERREQRKLAKQQQQQSENPRAPAGDSPGAD